MTTADQSRALALLISRDPSTWPEILDARPGSTVLNHIKRRASELFEKAAGEPMEPP